MVDMGATRRGVDGAALVGLRGYLGVSGGGGLRQNRAEDVFGDLERSVEAVLHIQEQQAGMLRGKNMERPQKQEEEDLARGYGPMLDGLDEEIAKVKENIEAVPG